MIALLAVNVLSLVLSQFGIIKLRHPFSVASARILPTFLSFVKGSIGGTTFSSVKGAIKVAKAKIAPQPGRIFTAAQRQQQRFMDSINAYFHSWSELINKGFFAAQRGTPQSAWNLFVKFTRAAGFVSGTPPVFTPSWAGLVVSHGIIVTETQNIFTTDVSDAQSHVKWEGTLSGNQLETDWVGLLVSIPHSILQVMPFLMVLLLVRTRI